MSGNVVKFRAKVRRNIVSSSKAMTGYRFIDKDPIIDEVMAAIKQSGLSISQVAKRSGGVSEACIRAWDCGRTKKPQNITVEWVMAGLGLRRPAHPWVHDAATERAAVARSRR